MVRTGYLRNVENISMGRFSIRQQFFDACRFGNLKKVIFL